MKSQGIGLLVVAAFTWVAYRLGSLVPYVSPLMVALFGGMLLGSLHVVRTYVAPGAKLAGKQLLRVAVAMMGLRLSFGDFVALGWQTAVVIVATIVCTLWFGRELSRRMGLSSEFGALISTGTAICGASAVAAVAPVVDAKESEVTFSITLVTLFGLAGVIVYPPLGHALGMTDTTFGIWAGTAIHDTAQVMAAAFSFSPGAGEAAAAAKMLRITGLLPVTLLFMVAAAKRSGVSPKDGLLATAKRSVPGFLVAFVVLVFLRTIGLVPDAVANLGVKLSEVMLVMAMVGVGMSTRLRSLAALGWRSVVVGLSCAIVAGLVGYVGIALFGIGY